MSEKLIVITIKLDYSKVPSKSTAVLLRSTVPTTAHKGTPKQLMDALPSAKKPGGRPRTRWRNYVEDLAWSPLGIPPAKLPLVAGDRNAWRF